MIRLDVDSLTVKRGETELLHCVSLAARAGEFIGLVGPNGAGKTTLLRGIAGLEKTGAGSVSINGASVTGMAARIRARTLAYLPQAREVHWAITAEAVVALGRFAYGLPGRLGPADRTAVERALAATESTSFRSRVASTLSGGEQARIHLARALAAEAPILLADEPTAALDLKHALSIAATLRAKADGGGLVLAALHDLELARRFCTRIVVLNEGRIAADGDPVETFSENLIAGVFGVTLHDLGRLQISSGRPRPSAG